ncbi:MAG: UDP-glucose 4-epimerase GalE [Clostridia bacterium]|nr:UDP-glucose 4-epimerase GalE [Clostridia bacterium]
MSLLLTGGTGFIGSHTAVEFIQAGYDVVIADDLSNSSADVVDRIETITGVRPAFAQADLCDAEAVEKIFAEHTIEGVVHFAGFKAVGESVEKPIDYYRNNLLSTLTLLEVMKRHACKVFVFSSSATVYGENNPIPYVETMPAGGCTNPYGWSKFMNEQILMDAAKADPSLSVCLLRYFNPIGAHESGLLGDDPSGIPNNLMPYITRVAKGVLPKLSVFGNDYPTVDGTGVRDYIHVVDLAKGHLAAYKYAAEHTGTEIFNLGSGSGTSVLELVETFKRVNGIDVPYVIAPRRAGDIAEFYADASKADRVLHWRTEKTVEDMCRDSWNWEQKGAAKR